MFPGACLLNWYHLIYLHQILYLNGKIITIDIIVNICMINVKYILNLKENYFLWLYITNPIT